MAITPNLAIDLQQVPQKLIEVQNAIAALDAAETGVLNGVTPGTAAASKALVLGESGEIATITSLTATTITGTNLVLAAGGNINLDSATATLSSHAATITKWAAVITTEALTTAAGASQAFALTLTGVAAGDLVFVQHRAGTSTGGTPVFRATTSTNTVTVTVDNKHASAALDGTLIFSVLVMKA